MQPQIAELIDTELGKRWHEKRSLTLSRLYNRRYDAAQRKEARVTIWLAGALYILFSITDVILIKDIYFYSVVMRFFISIAYVLIIDFQLQRNFDLSVIDKQCAIGVFSGYAAWIWLSSYSQNSLSVSYYLTYGTIFMMITNLYFNFKFKLAALSSGLIVATLLISLFTIFNVNLEFIVAISVLYVSSYALTLFVNWKLNEERYRVFLNSLHAEIQQKEAIERGAALLRLSTTDALTGLANRRATDDELRALWEGWQSSRQGFAVVLIDIDYFKRFNDHYGHQEGDRCLVAVAGAMARATARHSCALGRFGGEEFIVLIRCESRDEAGLVAEEVRHAVESLRFVHEQRPDHIGFVTVSVGAAFSGDVGGDKVERLVTEADRALYGAKASGRNRVRVFDRNEPRKVDEDGTIADLLRSAVVEGRISLAYQPIREVESGRIVAAEALMRLTNTKGKPISPAAFIPVAERTGAIMELGRWAIATACRDLIGNDLVPVVSVNMSAVQLKAPGFALSVAAILGETGILPHRLALEVTEGLEIDNQPEIESCIRELKQLGVQVWLDDFGTGFAGLSCLRKIDFDVVKIDRSFLQASHAPKGAAMFRDMVGLLKNAGHAIVVEGIEDEEQLDFLAEQAVDLVQGFHLGKPMPLAAFKQVTVMESAEAAKRSGTAR
ncbi:MAG: EAL domain-containing protein [Methylobacterium sp.]|nr:EAL domain-containing protein [Methylobacterium sp.]